MPEKIELTAETQQLIKAVNDAVQSFNKYTEKIVDIKRVQEGMTKSGKAMVRTITAIDEANTKVIVSQTKVGHLWKSQTVDVTRLTAAEKKAIATTEKRLAQADKQIQKQERQIAAEQRLSKERAKTASEALQGPTKDATKLLTESRSRSVGATLAEQQAYIKSFETLQKVVQKHGVSAKQLSRIWQDNTGKVRRYANAMERDVRNAVLKVNAAQGRLGGQQKAFLARQQQIIDKQKEANSVTNKMLISWKSIVRLIVGSAIRRVLFSMVTSIVEGTKEAAKLQKAISEIQTISQDAQISTEQWFQSAVKLSNAFGGDVASQLEGAYQTLSNQVAKGADATIFLARANQFAKTAVSSTDEAVQLLSSTVNAYGIDASRAEEVSAKLFKTIELGRIRASQIANSFGDVAVIAKQTGTSLDELLAALAVMTRQGLAPSKAMTQLRGVLLKVLKPTDAMTEATKRWGFESAQQVVQVEGLLGLFTRLEKETNGNAAALAKFVPRMRGLTGALIFSGKGLNDYSEAIDKVKNSLDSYDKAQDIILNNAGEKTTIAVTRIKNGFKQLGNDIIETFAAALDFYTDFTDKILKERQELFQESEAANAVKAIQTAFEKSIDDRVQLTKKITAVERAELFKQVEAHEEAYDKIADAASQASTIMVQEFQSGISKLKSGITKAAKDIEGLQKAISESARKERDTLFAWAQETRTTAQQFQGLTERIIATSKERRGAVERGDVGEFNRLTKQLEKYIDTQRKLQIGVQKQNKKSADERVKLEERYGQTVLKIQERIFKARVTGKGSTQITREEIRSLSEIKKLYDGIEDTYVRTIDHAKALQIAEANAQESRKRLAISSAKAIKEQRAELLVQQIRLESLKGIIKTVEEFDGIEIAKGDPKEAIESFKKYNKSIEEAKARSKQLGLTLSGIFGAGRFKALQQENDKLVGNLKKRIDLQKQEQKIADEKKGIDRFKETISKEAEYQAALKRREAILKDLKDLQTNVVGDASLIAKQLQNAFERSDAKAVSAVLNGPRNLFFKSGIGKGENTLQDRVLNSLLELKQLDPKLRESLEEVNSELGIAQLKLKLLQEQFNQTTAIDNFTKKVNALNFVMQRLVGFEHFTALASFTPLGQISPFATGKTSFGSENVPALLGAKELVINKANSERYFSQLTQLGAQPAALASGGINMGDLNVSMPQASGGSQYDAMQIAHQVVKYMKRGIV